MINRLRIYKCDKFVRMWIKWSSSELETNMANDKQLMIQQSDSYKVYHHTYRPIIENMGI